MSGLPVILVGGAVCLGILAGVMSVPTNVCSSLLLGALFFGLYSWGLAALSRVLFGGRSGVPRKELSFGFLLLAAGIKVFGVGAAAYVALVLLKLNAAYFVTGALLGLLAFVASVCYRSARIKKSHESDKTMAASDN